MVAPTVVGQRLANRYRVLRHLADGTTGAVYLAEDVATTQRVVVKVLIPELSFDERTLTFLRARLQRNVKMPRVPGSALEAIVDLTDVGTLTNDDLYVVMPLVGGENLAGLLSRRGRLSWAQAKMPLIRIGEVIAAYHGEMIAIGQAPALGTLQASNCYAMKGEGPEATIKIINSGVDEVIVRRMWREGGEHVRSLARYGAPELSAGEKIDIRADVYAFGVIMYELLTGRVPFDDPNVARLEAMHLMSPPPAMQSLVPRGWVPPKVEAVILKALAKKPEERFEGMGALVTALTAAANAAEEAAVPKTSHAGGPSGKQVRSGMALVDESGQHRWPSERSGPKAVGAKGTGARVDGSLGPPTPPVPPAPPPSSKPAAEARASEAPAAAEASAGSPSALEEAAAEAVRAAREAEAERAAKSGEVAAKAAPEPSKTQRSADTVITRMPMMVPEEGGPSASGLRRRSDAPGAPSVRRGRSSADLGGPEAEVPSGPASSGVRAAEESPAASAAASGARPAAEPAGASAGTSGLRARAEAPAEPTAQAVTPPTGRAPTSPPAAAPVPTDMSSGRAAAAPVAAPAVAAPAPPGAAAEATPSRGLGLWLALIAVVLIVGVVASGQLGLGAKPAPGPGPGSQVLPELPPMSEAQVAKDLLEQARISEQGGDMQAAYRLASESYEKVRTTEALEVMGRSACRLGDVDMARWIYRHLPASSQGVMHTLCDSAGVRLEP